MSKTKRSRPPKKRRRRSESRAQRLLLRWGWILPVGAIAIGGGVLALTYAFASIPLPEDIDVASSAQVYDRSGQLIGTYTGDVRRFLIDTTELPEYIGQAVISAEDRSFYEHNGVSFKGIFRAAWANATGGQIQQGGSTITQQYIKNAVLQDPSRTVTRKAKEAILAIKLERRYSKPEILDFYLNTIYLGRGAYGIEAAARTYFNRNAKDLSLNQAAYLAGIIPAPESYQPDENPRGAEERRNRVLDQMVRAGYIDAVRAAGIKPKRVRLAKGEGGRAANQRAAYFMEWLRKDFLYPEYQECLYTCGLKIYTTLDLDMQADAEVSIESILTEPADPQASLVAMTRAGAVRAFVGGRDYTSVKKAKGFNFAADYPGRQAGSAFKPFTLLAAIEDGISPNSRFSGASPRTITEEECYTSGVPWKPSNYGGSSFGTVTLDQATTNSVNTVFAQLIAEVGADKVAELVEDFGFHPPPGETYVPSNCSLSLGTLDVTPVEMARAYAGFAARGALPDVMPIRYITNNEGHCLKKYRPNPGLDCDEDDPLGREQVVQQTSADVLNTVLTHVVQGGTATAANIGRPVAGKTGTTQNNVNAWFAGHVPQMATVVWMGYPKETTDDGRVIVPQMGYCSDTALCRPVHGREVTGGSFPAQIWSAFMSEVTLNMVAQEFPTPTATPTRLVNPPPPPSTPTPTKKAKPTPKESITPIETPTPEPTPTDVPPPSPVPTAVPSPTTRAGPPGGADP